ncbi:Peptidase S74 domain-containing protein [Entamoeba marina]
METQAKPRRKCWMCVFPGCTEPRKTRYNCYSHVWDAHLRHLNGEKEAYKRIKEDERKEAMRLCEMYIIFVDDDNNRRRNKTQKQNEISFSPDRIAKIDESLSDLSPNQGNFLQQRARIPFGAKQSYTPTQAQDLQQFQQSNTNYSFPNQTQNNSFNHMQNQSTFVPTQQNQNSCPIPSQPLSDTQQNPQYSPSNPNTTSPQNEFIQQPQQQQQPQQFTNQTDLFQTATDPLWDYMNSPQQFTESQENGEFIKVEAITENLKRLHVMGEVFAENGFLQRSDERFKENIKPLVDSVNNVLKLTGKSFHYIGKEEEKHGFIAQEVREVLPELVKEDSNGELSIDVIGIIPHLVEALKTIHSTASDEVFASNMRFRQLSETTQKVMELVEDFSATTQLQMDEEKQNSDKQSVGKMLFFNFSFGPALATSFASFFFTLISLFVVFSLPQFPFMWGYCWFTTILTYLSVWNTRAEFKKMWERKAVELYFTPTNFISIYLFLVLAVIGVTVSMVMGTVVLIVMIVYVSICVVVGGICIILYQKYKIHFATIAVMLVALLIAMTIVSYSLFVTQPGYQCYINDDYNHNYELDITLNEPIQRQMFTPIPWNCMKYSIESSPHLPNGINVGSVRTDVSAIPYIDGLITEYFPTTKVEMFLECVKYVRIRCGVITMKMCDGRNQSSCELNGCQWCGSCMASC